MSKVSEVVLSFTTSSRASFRNFGILVKLRFTSTCLTAIHEQTEQICRVLETITEICTKECHVKELLVKRFLPNNIPMVEFPAFRGVVTYRVLYESSII